MHLHGTVQMVCRWWISTRDPLHTASVAGALGEPQSGQKARSRAVAARWIKWQDGQKYIYASGKSSKANMTFLRVYSKECMWNHGMVKYTETHLQQKNRL